MSNVLVIFQANTERTEQFALAVAVGAVESEASIRLRRLAAPGSVEVGHKGYGTLKEADLLWADVIVVGLEDERPSEELDALLSALTATDKTSFPQKHAWTFGAGGVAAAKTEAQRAVEEALRTAGLTVLPAVVPDANDMTEQMKEAGQKLGQKRD
jgi:hypothetical protein